MRLTKAAAVLFGSGVVALYVLGIVFVYSATIYRHGERYLLLQGLWAGLGLVAGLMVALMDYRLLKRFWLVLYALVVVLLALVLIPGLGVEANGARRWLSICGQRFQPSELAKVALLVALARYCEWHRFLVRSSWRGLVVPLLLIVGVAGLTFLEPDRGTALLVSGLGFLMLWVAGVGFRYVGALGLVGAVAAVMLLYRDPTILGRVRSWLDGASTGVGYQQYQSRLAMAEGGVLGKGWGDGRQKLGYVPEVRTDFILSVIGEERGFVGSMVVLLLFVMVVVCCVVIASRAPDEFGMLMGCGIGFLIGAQALVNMCVASGALPAKGLPLPFVSYGGSSLIVMGVLAGLVLSIARVSIAESCVADEMAVAAGVDAQLEVSGEVAWQN